MVYTSYFALYRGDKGVSVTLYNKFWKGENLKDLAPTKRILEWWKAQTPEYQKSSKGQDIYERLYRRDVLSKLNPLEIYEKLDGKVILCYEKTGDFCHRHIICKWLRENGFETDEITYEKK